MFFQKMLIDTDADAFKTGREVKPAGVVPTISQDRLGRDPHFATMDGSVPG
jgi:hypothetical protein